MQLTRSDASAVQQTARLVALLDRGVVLEAELVKGLFDNLHGCDTDLGIEQCVARIPARLWSQIEERATEILSRTHPGEPYFYQPTQDEMGRLDARVRHAVAVVLEYLKDPTDAVEYPIDDESGLRQKWFLFKTFETVANEKCRKAECEEDRIRNGVYCRAHHFEMIFGQRPPTSGSNASNELETDSHRPRPK